MKALVTGATGFIGNHVAACLLDHGWQVRALIRPGVAGQRRSPLPDGAEPVPGDIRDQDAVDRAVRGCQAVFHVAALYDLWAARPQDFYDINVEGTRTVLQAAYRAGVERTIYTSSVATLLPGRGPHRPAQPQEVQTHYKRSKILAERAALDVQRQGLPLIVVHPSTPVGPKDVRPTPTGRIVLDFIRGRMPAFVDTGLNVIDVADVAEGHVLAHARGREGQHYILGHLNLTLRNLLARLAALTGRPRARLRLPMAAAYGIGLISEVLQGRLLRRQPTVPLDAVRLAATPMYFNAAAAVTELALPQTPIDAALLAAAAWFEAHGYR